MTRIDRSPTSVSSGLSLGAAFVVTAVVAPYETVVLALCGIGATLLALGLVTTRRSLVTVGSGSLVFATIVAGSGGGPVLVTLVGVTAAILAWDFASTALTIGSQLGRQASTVEIELVHATASALVGIAIVLGSYLVYTIATDGQPVAAVFGLVVAVVILIAALQRADPLRGTT
jgi:hypothetical protein